jgi:hypothetical protein
VIDPAPARHYVVYYLRASGVLPRYPGLGWTVTTSSTTVLVRLVAPLDLPLRVPGVDTRTTVSGTAASVVMVSD